MAIICVPNAERSQKTGLEDLFDRYRFSFHQCEARDVVSNEPYALLF